MIERRFTAAPSAGGGLALDAKPAGGGFTLGGYGALFDSYSLPIGGGRGDGFIEVLKPGAFAKSLRESPDVASLFNHDSNFILGRTSAGTLRLWEDARGLRYELLVAPTSFGEHVATAVRRGDVRGSSFAFTVVKDTWHVVGGRDLRTVHELVLHEVGPVTSPAFPETESIGRVTHIRERTRPASPAPAQSLRLRKLRTL